MVPNPPLLVATSEHLHLAEFRETIPNSPSFLILPCPEVWTLSSKCRNPSINDSIIISPILFSLSPTDPGGNPSSHEEIRRSMGGSFPAVGADLCLPGPFPLGKHKQERIQLFFHEFSPVALPFIKMFTRPWAEIVWDECLVSEMPFLPGWKFCWNLPRMWWEKWDKINLEMAASFQPFKRNPLEGWDHP